MNKENYLTKGHIKKVNPSYFTGPVIAREITNLKIPEHKIYFVTFKKGTVTKLHYHQGGQTLIVTKGNGVLIYYKKASKGKSRFKIKMTKKTPLKVGDIVYIPAKELHAHGSINSKKDFSHIAINSSPIKNQEPKTTWFESDFSHSVSKIL